MVSHPVNPRPGRSHPDGRRIRATSAGALVFVTFDADGQHRVDDVRAMIDRMSAGDVDIVIGTRFGAAKTGRFLHLNA